MSTRSAPYWDVCPKLRNALFKHNRAGYLDLAVEKTAIKSDDLRTPGIRRLHRRDERPLRRLAKDKRRHAARPCRTAAIRRK